MGYTTTFKGSLSITPELEENIVIYIKRFNKTRRMGCKGLPLHEIDNPDFVLGNFHIPAKKVSDEEFIVGKRFGTDGEFFVNNDIYPEYGPLIDRNPPSTQPGQYCRWTVKDGAIQWDGVEKFSDYIEWLQYLIDNIFIPNGYTLTGSIKWYGDERSDVGIIIVDNNIITIKSGHIIYN